MFRLFVFSRALFDYILVLVFFGLLGFAPIRSKTYPSQFPIAQRMQSKHVAKPFSICLVVSAEVIFATAQFF